MQAQNRLILHLVMDGLDKLRLFFKRAASIFSVNVYQSLVIQVLNQQHRTEKHAQYFCARMFSWSIV